MQSLEALLTQLTKGRNLHISVLDLTGILYDPLTQLSLKDRIHSRHFCDLAKSTEDGYRFCLYCKHCSIDQCLQSKSPFCGHCLYGIYEAVFPVIIRDSIAAIVYVGNAIWDEAETQKRLHMMTHYAELEIMQLQNELQYCEQITHPEELLQIAELVADYIKYLVNSSPKTPQKLHWLVSLLKQYADDPLYSNISLKEIAATHQKNEKYLGRLFQKEMGIGWNEYCIRIRMEKAEQQLRESNDKIIDIALECGFNSISYFNRLFQKKHGMSPRAYRLQHQR